MANNFLQNAEDFLPTIGGVVGGIGGGLAGGVLDIPTGAVPGAVAGGVAGAGVGGALGEGLKQKLQNRFNPGDIATQGAVNAGGEALGGGVGLLGKAALSKVGAGAARYGTGLITKGLNLTPKMESDVARKMGVPNLSSYLAQRGLHGADYQKLSDYLDPVQQQFDSIAKNPDIRISPSDVVQHFNDEIQQLKGSILPADQEKAQHLQQIALNFIDKYGHMPDMGADELTQLRRNVDKGVKDFGANPVVASTGNITRNVLQKAVQEADPSQTLKPIGDELNKGYTLLSKTEQRQFANQPRNAFPLNIQDMGAGWLGQIFGGPVGAAVGIGAEKGLSTQTGTRLAGAAARGIGGFLQKASDALPLIGGALGAAAMPGQDNEQDKNNSQNLHGGDYSTNAEQNPQDILQDPARDPQTGHWNTPTDLKPLAIPGDNPKYTQDWYTNAMSSPDVINHPETAAAYQRIWDTAQATRQSWLNSHTPTGAVDFVNNFPVQLAQQNALRDIIQKYSTATGVQNFNDLIKYAEAQHDPQVAVAQGIMANNQAAQTHETLGRVTNFDINYLQNFPQATDSKATALAKLDRFGKTSADTYRQFAPYVNYTTTTGSANQAPLGNASAPAPAPVQQTSQDQMPAIPAGFHTLSGL